VARKGKGKGKGKGHCWLDGCVWEPQFGNLVLDYSKNPWKGEEYGCGLKDGNLHYGRKFIGNHFHFFFPFYSIYLFIFLHFGLYEIEIFLWINWFGVGVSPWDRVSFNFALVQRVIRVYLSWDA
jgi:hypothetical protein